MIDTAVTMLQEIAATVPDTAPGMERQMLIGDLVSRQSPAERTRCGSSWTASCSVCRA